MHLFQSSVILYGTTCCTQRESAECPASSLCACFNLTISPTCLTTLKERNIVSECMPLLWPKVWQSLSLSHGSSVEQTYSKWRTGRPSMAGAQLDAKFRKIYTVGYAVKLSVSDIPWWRFVCWSAEIKILRKYALGQSARSQNASEFMAVKRTVLIEILKLSVHKRYCQYY